LRKTPKIAREERDILKKNSIIRIPKISPRALCNFDFYEKYISKIFELRFKKEKQILFKSQRKLYGNILVKLQKEALF